MYLVAKPRHTAKMGIQTSQAICCLNTINTFVYIINFVVAHVTIIIMCDKIVLYGVMRTYAEKRKGCDQQTNERTRLKCENGTNRSEKDGGNDQLLGGIRSCRIHGEIL